MKSISLLIFVFVLLACNERSIHQKQLQAVVEIRQEFTDTLKKILTYEKLAIARKAGWTINDSELILIAPIRNMMFLNEQGDTIRTDKDGFLSGISTIEKQGSELSANEKLLNSKGIIALRTPILITKTGLINIFLRKNENTKRLVFMQAFNDKHNCCVMGDKAAGDPMDDERCLDYNGIDADGQNRPKDDVKAYVNFINSDCNYAVLQFNCGLDHQNGGCYKNHGNKICSELIGHSPSYHTH